MNTPQAPARPENFDVFNSREINLQSAAFLEILAFDLNPQHRGWVLQVSPQIIDTSNGDEFNPAYAFVFVDVRIVGFVGSAQTPLYRGSLGGDAGPVDVSAPHPSPYQRIQVLARPVFNGLAGWSPTLAIPRPRITCAAQARISR